MRVIAHSPSNNTSYVIDTRTLAIEWAGDREACEAYLKYMTFHDFYYSVKDRQGPDHPPVPTINYWDVFTSINDTHIANHLFQVDMSRASGWTYQLT